MLAKDRAMVRDVTYPLSSRPTASFTTRKKKSFPIMVNATKKPQDAVSFCL